MWQSLFLPQLDSLDIMPSRSRKADTRGANYVRIIPQNSNFIYNKFIKILCHCEKGSRSRRTSGRCERSELTGERRRSAGGSAVSI